MDSITNVELNHRTGRGSYSEFSCNIGGSRLRVTQGSIDIIMIDNEIIYESMSESDVFDSVFESLHQIYYASQQVGHVLFPDSYAIIQRILSNLEQESYSECSSIN